MWTERFDATGHLLAIREIVGRLDGRLDSMSGHFDQRLTRVEDLVEQLRDEVSASRGSLWGRNWQEIALIVAFLLLATGNLTADDLKQWLLR